MSADRDAARRPWWRPGRPTVADLFAGVTVALLLIPQSMAYAEIAGLPVEVGLVAASLPLIVTGFFGSSPYLQIGPVALISLLTLGALTDHAATGSAAYIELAALLALVVGVTRLVLGVLRLGTVAFLMSEPMVLGFTNAAAILILASQVPTALGTAAPDGGVLYRAGWSLAHPDRWEATAIAFTLLVLVLMLGGRRVHRLFPGVLLAVAVSLALAEGLSYDGAVIGSIPSHLPTLSLDLPWGRIGVLLVPGVIIALVGFAETASIARTFATADRIPWDPDREFVSSGLGNLTAALTGGYPVEGSFSRSSLNRFAGARTRWSGVVTGLAVLAFLPVASVLEDLPRAVLAGVVIGAVLGLLHPIRMTRIWTRSWPQGLVALTTFVATLVLAPRIERAVVLGVGLTIVVHLARDWNPRLVTEIEDETLVVRPRGVLWFVTAPRVEQRTLEVLADHPEIQRLVLDLDDVIRTDFAAASTLAGLLHDLRRAGLAVEVVRVSPGVRRRLAAVITAETAVITAETDVAVLGPDDAGRPDGDAT